MKAHVFGKQDLQERAGIEIRKLNLFFDIPELSKHVTMREAGGEVKNIYEHLVLVSDKVIAENRFPGLGITNKYQLANIIKTIFYEAIESCSQNKQPAFIATVEKFRPDFVGGDNKYVPIASEDLKSPREIVVTIPPQGSTEVIDDSEREETKAPDVIPVPLDNKKGPNSLETLSVKYKPNARRKSTKPARPSRATNTRENKRNVGRNNQHDHQP